MPDKRKHRGPHPHDHELFAEDVVPTLQAAVADLSWLLSHGYATVSSLKLVGDRYDLKQRQRLAVARCSCAYEDARRRKQHQVGLRELAGRELWIDCYNVLTSLEAALSQGVILLARDGCYRDMASMHGSYRKVEETLPALQLIGETLAEANVENIHWLLDQPVSNSGRLAAILREQANSNGWNWTVDVVPDPDRVLIETEHIVASADSHILDHATAWLNLARTVIDARIVNAWIADLSTTSQSRV